MTSARHSIRLLVIATALAAAITMAPAETAEGDCDRECLRGFITRYLNAMIAHTPGALPAAATVRFTEDTVDMKLGDGLWKQASKIRPYRLDILDVAQGVAASQVVVEEAGSPVMLMLRLKVAEQRDRRSRNPGDAEARRKGRSSPVDALQSPNAAMIETIHDPAKRSSRADAIELRRVLPGRPRSRQLRGR